MDLALLPLDAPIRTYAWGSHHTLAELQGRPSPSADPEAELWCGAHPSAPARVTIDGTTRGLDEVIHANPSRMLGVPLLERFGDQLPFLLKILAIERPLSIQAHPDRTDARRGFLEESRRNLPLDAPQRVYRDPRPKPEQVVALTPFDALVGFRPADELEQILAAWGLGGQPLEQVVRALLREGEAARHAVLWGERSDPATPGLLGDAARTFRELAALYPGDAGLPVAMLLNRVRLQPGESLYLGAGMLHAYLHGTVVEVMGNSDNTLRCGLTAKYVARDELMAVVSFVAQVPEVLKPTRVGGEAHYPSPTPFFALSCLEAAPGGELVETGGPEIWLVTRGSCTLEAGDQQVVLRSGSSCFVPASTPSVTLRGEAQVFRARAED